MKDGNCHDGLFDELFEHIERSNELLIAQYKSFLELPHTLKEAWRDYAERHGREPLTTEEKRQAFLDALIKRLEL